MPQASLLKVTVVSHRDLVRTGLAALIQGALTDLHVQVQATLTSDVNLAIGDVADMTQTEVNGFSRNLLSTTAPALVLTDSKLHIDFSRWPRPPFALFTLSTTTYELTSLVNDALSVQSAQPSKSSSFIDHQATTLGLSRREAEVLALIAQGLTNDEIGHRLHLGINTVKTYIRTCYRKINVTTRTQALLWALQHGFRPAASDTPLNTASRYKQGIGSRDYGDMRRR